MIEILQTITESLLVVTVILQIMTVHFLSKRMSLLEERRDNARQEGSLLERAAQLRSAHHEKGEEEDS